MKRPIAWHEECLANLRISLAREAASLARLKVEVAAISDRAARLAAQIDEAKRRGMTDIGLGIYPGRGGHPKWREVTYSKTASLRREVETPLPAYGAVQGILHAWFKEAREPYFQIRELSTEALVRVTYPSRLYSAVANAVQERTTMLIVSGDVQFNRATHQPVEMHADRIQPQGMSSAAEFETLVGSAPEFTADYDDEDAEEEAL